VGDGSGTQTGVYILKSCLSNKQPSGVYTCNSKPFTSSELSTYISSTYSTYSSYLNIYRKQVEVDAFNECFNRANPNRELTGNDRYVRDNWTRQFENKSVGYLTEKHIQGNYSDGKVACEDIFKNVKEEKLLDFDAAQAQQDLLQAAIKDDVMGLFLSKGPDKLTFCVAANTSSGLKNLDTLRLMDIVADWLAAGGTGGIQYAPSASTSDADAAKIKSCLVSEAAYGSELTKILDQQAQTYDPGTSEGGTSTKPSKSCESEGGTMSWIICPLLFMADGIIGRLDKAITSLLVVPSSYFENAGLKSAWKSMRDIAYLLLVPTVLIMVISTALGFEFVSAYTVKRALPRMIAAIIFIAISYEVTKFLIILTNDVGTGIYGLVTSAFNPTGADITLASVFSPDAGNSVVSFGLIVAGGGAALAVGSIGIVLSYLFVGVIGLLMGFFLLSFRQLLLVAIMIVAPLAILSWIFPGNDKPWKLWWQTFSKLLIMFPIIMLLIAVGKSFSLLVAQTDEKFASTLIKLVAYVGPYFFIPSMFKLAGGIFATVAGIANDKNRGLFDRQKKYRQGKAAQNYSEFKSGDKKWRPKSFNTLGTRVGVGLGGGFGYTSKGKGDLERMRVAKQAERMKEPGVQDLMFDDDVRGSLMQGDASSAKAWLDSRVASGAIKAVKDDEGNVIKTAEQVANEKLGAAKSVGFDRTSTLAAFNFEAPNKSRNFVDEVDADGNVVKTANEVMRETVARVAQQTGVDEGRLLQNYMYAAGSQGGRLDLRAESVDKVIESKFDTRLMQQTTATGWEAITKRNLELLKTGTPEQKLRSGAQLLAMQESLAGTSEESRQKFVELMSQDIDYTSTDAMELQLARLSGLSSETSQSDAELAYVLRSTSSTYGSAREDEARRNETRAE